MSNFSIIHDVSLELRAQIFNAWASTPDTDFGVATVDRITLMSPGETLDATIVASLFLYHIDIDANLRNQRMLADATLEDRFHKPPLPLQLRYLLTPTGDEEENQLLIGRTMQHFHDSPHFSTTQGSDIGNSRGGATAELRVVSDPLPFEQLTQLWNAFSAPYRTAIALQVSVLAIDSGLPATQISRVGEVLPAAGNQDASS